ncbi:hypothetical protein U1Q18_001142, partial [Sarracenia purpurea var. burkii]
RSHSKSNDKKSSTTMFCKLDFKKKSDWNIQIAEPQPSFSEVVREDELENSKIGSIDSEVNESNENLKSEMRHIFSSKTRAEKLHRFGSLRSRSRV